MANPLGLIAVAISTVIAGLVSLTAWFNKSKRAAEEAAAKYKKTVEVINGITVTSLKPIEDTKKALPPISVPKIPKTQIADMGEHNKLLTEAKQIFEQTRTPIEKHNSQMTKLNSLLKQGLIDQDTFNRDIEQSKEGIEQIATKTEDVFSVIKDHSKDAANNLIDNFADATFGIGDKMKSLKDTCSDIFKQIQADILKMTIKQGLFGSSGSGGILGSLLGLGGKAISSGGRIGSLFAGFFAGGGTAKAGKAHIVGDGGEAELFIPNSSGSIIPFSKLQEGGANNKPHIVVNMNIQTPDI